jgi:ribosome biogenesis protein ENP2
VYSNRLFSVLLSAVLTDSHLVHTLGLVVVAMQCLTDDYSKLAMALDNREVEVHARYGYHYRVRVPKHCRDLAYHFPTCDLVVVGSSPDVWRINLDQVRQSLTLSLCSRTVTACRAAH